jgi:hypothetical protein
MIQGAQLSNSFILLMVLNEAKDHIKACENIYFLKSFTTLNTAKLINIKDIAEAVNEPSIDA